MTTQTKTQLMNAFNFTQADLRANQRGQATPTQREQFQRRLRQPKVMFRAITLAVMAGITACIFIAVPASMLSEGFGLSPSFLTGYAIVAVLSVLLFSFLAYRLRRSQNAPVNQATPMEIVRAEGVARLNVDVRSKRVTDADGTQRTDTNRHHVLTLGKAVFDNLSAIQFSALEDGQRYAVYAISHDVYLSHRVEAKQQLEMNALTQGGHIFSIERLES